MNGRVSRAGATICKGLAGIWLAAAALWVLVHYGTDGVLGAILLALVAWASLRLGGWETSSRSINFVPPRFGPTDDELNYDPTYNAYAGNAFHKHYHEKK